jgi:hypothetical protein
LFRSVSDCWSDMATSPGDGVDATGASHGRTVGVNL